jgi:hypothetical protein
MAFSEDFWRSAFTSITDFPCRALAIDSWTDKVLLETPPLVFPITITAIA